MLVLALKRAIQFVVRHCPEDDMEVRQAIGTMDVIHSTLGSAGVTDIYDLRRRLGVKDPKKEDPA